MHPLYFHGHVEKGSGTAKTKLDCATANISIEQGSIIPALGIYIGLTHVDGTDYPSLVFVSDGREGLRLKMEVHLLDVSMDLVQKRLSVALLERVRDIIPFPGDEQMCEILRKDQEIARKWFENHKEVDLGITF